MKLRAKIWRFAEFLKRLEKADTVDRLCEILFLGVDVTKAQ